MNVLGLISQLIIGIETLRLTDILIKYHNKNL
jgi:hypothetical protein